MITWSDKPGCFERHLQRKYSLPFLFPHHTNGVSSSDVEDARRRDSSDFAKLMDEAIPLLNLDRKKNVTVGEAQEYIRQIDTFERRAAEIGGNAEEFGRALKDLRLTLMSLQTETLTKQGENFAELQADLAAVINIQNQSFLAQSNRADTPIGDSEVTASLLTEHPNTISDFISIMQLAEPEWVIERRAEALELVGKAITDGHMMDGVRAKLYAFGIQRSQVLFLIVSKQITRWTKWITQS